MSTKNYFLRRNSRHSNFMDYEDDSFSTRLTSSSDESLKADTLTDGSTKRRPKCGGHICLYTCETEYNVKVPGEVIISYDFEVHSLLNANLSDALPKLESHMLRIISRKLGLIDCAIDHKQSFTKGMVLSLASSPRDIVDNEHVECIVDVKEGSDKTSCIPIRGFMTARHSEDLSQDQVSDLINILLHQGMDKNWFVTDEIQKLSFIGTRGKPRGSTLNEPENMKKSNSRKMSVDALIGSFIAILIIGIGILVRKRIASKWVNRMKDRHISKEDATHESGSTQEIIHVISEEEPETSQCDGHMQLVFDIDINKAVESENRSKFHNHPPLFPCEKQMSTKRKKLKGRKKGGKEPITVKNLSAIMEVSKETDATIPKPEETFHVFDASFSRIDSISGSRILSESTYSDNASSTGSRPFDERICDIGTS